MVQSSPPSTGTAPLNTSPKRRQPRIAAMETGPGPAKYKLPSSIGHKEHLLSKRKLPAYSFGTRTKQFSSIGTRSCSPGPVYLVSPAVTRTGKDGTPKYSLHGLLKSQDKQKSPGPATYDVQKVTPPRESIAPAYSFGLKPNLPSQRNVGHPSPCAYTLPSLVGSGMVGKRSTPAYSITGRSKIGSFHEDTKKTPGPGTYSSVDAQVYGSKSPVYSIHDRCPLPADNSKKPGPGAHSPEKVVSSHKKAPAYSFGIKHSEYLALDITV